MTDFVVVIVATALIVPPIPGDRSAAAVPLSAPTVGFTVYRDSTSCEDAVGRMITRPGTRLVCVPVEPVSLESASLF